MKPCSLCRQQFSPTDLEHGHRCPDCGVRIFDAACDRLLTGLRPRRSLIKGRAA